MPARALKGKTPYEMANKKKPYLGGIQEFGAVAFVKDQAAGKLDSQRKKGRFVGYESEPKGYRIYWPDKRSVTVEMNVVFNHDDTPVSDDIAIIPGETLSEGEKDKIIQAPQDNTIDNQEPNDQRTPENLPKPEETSNTIPFPSVDKPIDESEPQPIEDQPQQYGRGQRMRHPQGTYKALNQGLVAAISDLDDQDQAGEQVGDPNVLPGQSYDIPPDVALPGYTVLNPTRPDEPLGGPDDNEWRKDLEYRIRRLENLGTWTAEDLPRVQAPIPYTSVTRANVAHLDVRQKGRPKWNTYQRSSMSRDWRRRTTTADTVSNTSDNHEGVAVSTQATTMEVVKIPRGVNETQ
jgi:hypothetical protein